jgi:hypothetical protein
MFTSKDGITDKSHLVKTIQDKSSLKVSEKIVEGIVDQHLESAEEIYKDGTLAGYLLLFNFQGNRSFHAYKIIEGHAVRAFRLAKEFIQKHKACGLETTTDQTKVIRVAKMLGFTETRRVENLIAFGRMA